LLLFNDKKVSANMVDFSFSGCLLLLDANAVSIEQGEQMQVAISINTDLCGTLSGSAVKIQYVDVILHVGIKFSDEHPE
jgi:hypothetical protein